MSGQWTPCGPTGETAQGSIGHRPAMQRQTHAAFYVPFYVPIPVHRAPFPAPYILSSTGRRELRKLPKAPPRNSHIKLELSGKRLPTSPGRASVFV